MELDTETNKLIYLGPPGTYSHIAADKIAEKYSLKNVELEPIGAIKSIIDYADKNNVLAVVPIENSIEGVVRETIDNLTRAKDDSLKICAEYILPINNCLLAREKISKSEIKTILSYTQPLAQCRDYIIKNFGSEVNIIETSSTAAAAQKLLNCDTSTAAIANEQAAEVYGLEILERNINDVKDNKTRFVVLSKKASAPTQNDKTSIVFSTTNTPGALCDILMIFKKYNINLSYIDSRPSLKNLKEYNFYIDFDGHIDSEISQKAISEMLQYTTFFRHNGSYPKF